jgi:tRNA/rRNA methyltransferase
MPRADPLKNIRIVLCGTSHPGNIGAAARAMKTMGLTKLHLVQPQRFPDPEADWRAARAVDVLARAKVHETLEAALHGVGLAVACSARTREIAVPQSWVREVAAHAIGVARSQPVALVFGNETFGLTTEQVNKCGVLATIPANPRYPSLNLAAAVQVFTYELRTAAQANEAPALQPRLARHEDVERFYTHLETLMAEVGFLNPEYPKKLMPRLRRLFGRARLEPQEINILRGIIKALAHSKR